MASVADRKLRVSVEIYDHEPANEYVDLPDGWDAMTEAEQETAMLAIGKDYLFQAANYGVAVVRVDEHDREIKP